MLSSLTIRLSVAAILQQPSNVKAYMCVYVWWMCRGASVCQAWRASCRPRTLGKRNRSAPDSGAEPTHSSHHTHGFSRAPPRYRSSTTQQSVIHMRCQMYGCGLENRSKTSTVEYLRTQTHADAKHSGYMTGGVGGAQGLKTFKDGGLLILQHQDLMSQDTRLDWRPTNKLRWKGSENPRTIRFIPHIKHNRIMLKAYMGEYKGWKCHNPPLPQRHVLKSTLYSKEASIEVHIEMPRPASPL